MHRAQRSERTAGAQLRPRPSTTDGGGGLLPYASWCLLLVQMGDCALRTSADFSVPAPAGYFLITDHFLHPESSASSSCRRACEGVRLYGRMDPAIEDVCPAISGEDGSRWMESISNDEDAPQCRICFDGGCFGEQGPLFRPCRCSGSMAWVHRECLDQWRRSSANPRSFFRCDNCLFEYRFGRAFVAYDRCSATVAVPLA